MLKTKPIVFAVGNEYQIMVELEKEALVSVKVQEELYFDESNGIMNSLSPIHRVCVPCKKLDIAKEYTVCVIPIINRKPYYTETEKELKFNFKFKPVPENNIRIYHIADAHSKIEEPVNAANTFGEIDLLILNGDIIDHSGSLDNFINIYEICSKITRGNVPVIFSRGNHDMRGNFAEKFADYTPSHNRNTYYTFKTGSIWGVILDCGEDKCDSNAEYGYTVACHSFRKRETEFLKNIIKNSKYEYDQDDVKTKLVISHIPFTRKFKQPFDIESDIYKEWSSLLKNYIKPDLMLCGHTHECVIDYVGSKNDSLGQPCTVIIGSEPSEDKFTGCGLVISDKQIEIVFTDNFGNTVTSGIIKR